MATSNTAVFSSETDDVFARVADRYDRLCDIFSFFIHRIWKSRMAARIAGQPPDLILDAASGTGDIPVRLQRILQAQPGKGRPKRILVTDLCPNMLAIARRKLGDTSPGIEYALLDVHWLAEIESGSIDLYSISFAIKICDRRRVLEEAMRVLKPGGMFYCLEAARVPNRYVHAAYLTYMDWCLPAIGWLAANGDSSTYDYLLRGIHDFPSQTLFADELRSHGFEDVSFENMTLGIVALHQGRKPPADPLQTGKIQAA